MPVSVLQEVIAANHGARAAVTGADDLLAQFGLSRLYGPATSAPPANPYLKLKQAGDRRLYKRVREIDRWALASVVDWPEHQYHWRDFSPEELRRAFPLAASPFDIQEEDRGVLVGPPAPAPVAAPTPTASEGPSEASGKLKIKVKLGAKRPRAASQAPAQEGQALPPTVPAAGPPQAAAEPAAGQQQSPAPSKIRIRPRNDLSPKIVKLVKELAQSGSCPQCKFYRHEPAPANFGKDGFYGPPYALLQGSLASMAEQPPFEGAPEVHKGDVCIIPNSREFFIATAGHEEWGHSHSVWGQVADDASWAVIARVPEEPFTTITDGGGITTRWLTPNVTEPFKLSIE